MIRTITGANGFLVQAAVNQVVQDFVSKHGDMGLERLNAGEVSLARIRESAQALPFLVDSRLVVIDSPSQNKDLGEGIDDVLASVNDQTDILFVETKFDKRSVLYKTLKKQTDFKEYNELAEPQLIAWLQDYALKAEGKLSSADARYLLQRVGLNQLRLKNELDKLLSYNPEVTRGAIDLLVEPNPQSTIFELLDSIFAGNVQRAMKIYQEQRKQKVEPQAILALLGWQLHILATVKAAGPKSADQVAAQAKLSPFVVRKAQNLNKRISGPELKQIVSSTLALDIRLKSESIDADEALQNLLLAIA